jgi:hypothetical protein
LVRIGLGKDSFHAQIQAKSKGFTFSTGEVPVIRDYRGHYSERQPANGNPTSTRRHEYIMSGMTAVGLLRHYLFRNRITEKMIGQYINEKIHRKWQVQDQTGRYSYDDIWILINWILSGNKNGSVLSMEDYEKEILPRLDPTSSGHVTKKGLIQLLFDAESVDEEQLMLKRDQRLKINCSSSNKSSSKSAENMGCTTSSG